MWRMVLRVFTTQCMIMCTSEKTQKGNQGSRIKDVFFFWWGLLHSPQQGPDRMKEKAIRLGKGKLLPKQKNPP
jgi:hypothetical protein